MSGATASNIDRIELLATAQLFLMALCSWTGVPDANKHVLRQTDSVDPLNRLFWLGLLPMTQRIQSHCLRLVEHVMQEARNPSTPRAAMSA